MRGVILALTILVMCAAVSYSFEDLTGFFVKATPTSIVISGTSVTSEGIPAVRAGQSITLFINPSRYGAKKYFTVHKYPSNLRRGIGNWCKSAQGTCLTGNCVSGFKCYGLKSVNYKTSDTFAKGLYYIKIYDYSLKDYITEPFEVI